MSMQTEYKAILTDDHLEWKGERPRQGNRIPPEGTQPRVDLRESESTGPSVHQLFPK